jgi:hypothetical protein
MELAQPRDELRTQRRIEPLAGSRVLLGDPRDGDRIGCGLENAERIGDGDAVKRLDQIAARGSQRLVAA